MIRAADVVSITPITRIAVNMRQNILRYLDAGALGVLMPMVSTKAEAQAAVDAVKYPPVGKRGLAGVRAKLVKQITSAGKPAGTIAYDFDVLKRRKEQGLTFISAGVNPLLVNASQEYLAAARGK